MRVKLGTKRIKIKIQAVKTQVISMEINIPKRELLNTSLSGNLTKALSSASFAEKQEFLLKSVSNRQK
ncbi:hypothetical protein UBN57_09080 [Helicobacter pylori]